jgi:outer membrane beta-barrel protein
MSRYRGAVLALLLALVPSSLAAQGLKFSASGFGGALIPTTDLVDEATTDTIHKFGLKTGWTLGGRAAVWITPRFGIEAEGAYASSDLDITNVEGGAVQADTTLPATLFYGSINAMYTVIAPPLDPFSVYLAGGIGVVSRSGDGIEQAFGSKTEVAGTLGVGFRYSVSPTVIIRADLRDYISSFKSDRLGSESKLQNDLLVTAGVEVGFGGS